MKKFGFYFSELIVATIAYLLIIWYFASKEYVFSSYNREISGLILFFFSIGIAMVIYHLRKLYREDQQLSLFFQRLEDFKTTTDQLLQEKYTVTPETLADSLRKTIDEHFATLKSSWLKERIYQILNMTVAANTPAQDTLSTLLQQKIEVRGNRIRYIAGILIMIGLLGTFLGLVQAIKYLQHFFTASESVDFTMLFSDMKQTLGGLDIAFGTSIGGITAYLVLGYLNIVFRTKQAYIINRIEEVTLEHLIPIMQRFLAGETQDLISRTIHILQTLPETVSKQLSLVLEETMQQTIGKSTDHLEATSVHLQHASEGIQAGQELFTKALGSFGDFLTRFENDKEQLLVSQEALASGIRDFSEALRINRRVFDQLAETIHHEHTTLAQLVQHLEEFFKNAQKDMQTILGEHSHINQELLASHTMLTTLLHDMKTFILDEQKGLKLLSTNLEETFGQARFQYLQLTEYLEELHKRLGDSEEQLAHLQATTSAIQQELDRKRNT